VASHRIEKDDNASQLQEACPIRGDELNVLISENCLLKAIFLRRYGIILLESPTSDINEMRRGLGSIPGSRAASSSRLHACGEQERKARTCLVVLMEDKLFD
jgi:hypothetical protein